MEGRTNRDDAGLLDAGQVTKSKLFLEIFLNSLEAPPHSLQLCSRS